MKRREFLTSAAGAGSALWLDHATNQKLLSRMPMTFAADSRIEILTGETIGTIAPEDLWPLRRTSRRRGL